LILPVAYACLKD